MSTNISGYVNSEDPRWDDGSPCISDENVDTIKNFPIHGNCPKCRHLYTGIPFTFPNDPTKHTRFECEECSHQIFGIGRSSTQTTLASVETLPKSRRNSGTSRLPNTCVCNNAPVMPPDLRAGPLRGLEEINPPGHLTPIAEINTLGGRSRATSLQGPSPTSPGREALRTDDTSHALDNTIRETSDAHQVRQSPFRIKGILHRLRRKKGSPKGNVHQSGKEIKFLGFQILFTRISSQHHRPSPSPGQDFAVLRDPNSSNLAAQPIESPTIEVRPAPYNQTNQTQHHTSENVEPQTDTELSRSPLDLNNPGGSTEEDSLAKKNRIKARRREKTLKSEAPSRPVCVCRPGCPCIRDDHGSDNSSGHSRDLLHTSQVPDHRLHGINNMSSGFASSRNYPVPPNPIHFAGIGNLFNASGRVSTEGSSSATASQIHLNRLSTTTTTWSSNDSDPSLPCGRPTAGRSSSLSILPPRRSGVHHDHLHSTQLPTGQSRLADPPLRNESLGSPTTSEPTGDENVIAVASPRTSGTSLSWLAGPELASEQTQPMSDETSSSSSSHTLSVNNEVGTSSQERTPRPLSQNELQNERIHESTTSPSPAPDLLAETLENLVSAGTTAHSSIPEPN